MTETGSTPPAGWHPDPHGRHQYRFWDGHHWTERVANHGQEGVDPVGRGDATGGLDHRQARGLGRRWLLLGGGAVVVAVIAIAAVWVVLGGGVGKGTGHINVSLREGDARIHQVHLDAGEAMAVAFKRPPGRVRALVMIDRSTKDRLDDLGFLDHPSRVRQIAREAFRTVPSLRDQLRSLGSDPHLDVDGFQGYVIDAKQADVTVAPLTGQYAVVFIADRAPSKGVKLQAFIRTKANPAVHHDLDTKAYVDLVRKAGPTRAGFYRSFVSAFGDDARRDGYVCTPECPSR